MKKNSIKKLVSAMALSLSLALIVPTVLPAAQVVTTVEAASPKLSATKKTVLAGQSFKLTIKNKGKNKVTWSTKNKKVATVKNGTVTAVAKGSTTIYAKVGKKKLSCKVTVRTNAYSTKAPSIGEISYGDISVLPYKASYKNGKIECTARAYNRYYGYKIKLTSLKNFTLYSRTYASAISSQYKDTAITSKVTFKSGLPTILGNQTKDIKVTFPAKNIKKKGFQLSSSDFLYFGGTVNFVYYYR